MSIMSWTFSVPSRKKLVLSILGFQFVSGDDTYNPAKSPSRDLLKLNLLGRHHPNIAPVVDASSSSSSSSSSTQQHAAARSSTQHAAELPSAASCVKTLARGSRPGPCDHRPSARTKARTAPKASKVLGGSDPQPRIIRTWTCRTVATARRRRRRRTRTTTKKRA